MDKPGNVYVAVVDDDENLCRSFARLLRAAGMQLITYKQLMSYKEFPPMQAPETWNLDGILKQVESSGHPSD